MRRSTAMQSDFHRRLHEEAVNRATAMLAMRGQGMTDTEIGRLFGITHVAVYNALKRHAMMWTRWTFTNC